MKILLIVSLIIILLLYNCQRPVEKTKCNHDKFIHEYAEENFDSDTFIVNFDYIFFANIGSDSIMITDNVSLYEIYKSQYIDKFSDFKIFLCSLYDDKTILKKEDIDNNIEKVNKIIFRKETLIIDSLSHENVDKIRDYYFTNDDFFRTNIEIIQNKKYNILYFFFKNKYYISHSDYDGSFLITEMNQLR